MVQEFPVNTDWQHDVVATRSPSGQVYLLLAVRKCTCEHCRYGVHFDTLWGSTTGEGLRLAWCGSCFNADYGPADLDEGLQGFWHGLVRRFDDGHVEHCWNAARPAIEDLERRGLV